MTHRTPEQVLERRREVLLAQDFDGFADLFAPDGVIEMPFAGPDLPARLEGQQAIRDFSQRTAASPMRLEDLDALAVHHTSDPEVLIVELEARVRVAASERVVDTRSIQVFRIRDGKILHFRDYFDPSGVAGLLDA
jgi:uncharacterized protein